MIREFRLSRIVTSWQLLQNEDVSQTTMIQLKQYVFTSNPMKLQYSTLSSIGEVGNHLFLVSTYVFLVVGESTNESNATSACSLCLFACLDRPLTPIPLKLFYLQNACITHFGCCGLVSVSDPKQTPARITCNTRTGWGLGTRLYSCGFADCWDPFNMY